MAVLSGGVAIWYGYPLTLSLLAPFSWEERDWNGDGRISYAEFTQAASLGKRPVECTGRVLGTEYFDTKAGNTFKIDCRRHWTGPREPRFI